MQVNKLKTFKASVSIERYPTKESINYSQLRFRKQTFNTFVLLKSITRGYSFAPIMNDYTKSLSMANIKETSIIGIDIDETKYKFNEYIERLKIKPTLAYTTFSNTDEKNRFRLIYVFDKPITEQTEFENTYRKIAYQAEQDTNEKIKDNCGKCFNRLFNGTNENALTYKSDIIYSREDFNNIKVANTTIPTKTQHKANPEQIKVCKNKEVIPQNIIDLLNQYNDYDELFLYLTKDLHNKVITESEVYYNNEGWADLTPQHIELKVIFDKTTKKPKVYNDGEHRKHLLYVRLQYRKAIKPNITMEELLTNALFDIKHFINNSDGEFHKQRVLDIVKSVFYDDCNVKSIENKKTFKIDKNYCAKHGITPNQYKMVVRRKKNDESIGQWYDISKSLTENLNYAKENNIKIGKTKLYEWVKENGIDTKGNDKQTPNIMEESTEQKPIYELNKTQLTPQEIEETIKNTYHSLDEFENDFEDLKNQFKPILEKERVTNYSNKWLELLKHYQSLKITA